MSDKATSPENRRRQQKLNFPHAEIISSYIKLDKDLYGPDNLLKNFVILEQSLNKVPKNYVYMHF